MGERPAVSVIVPTYERREWCARAARSVLSQTFGDFELIVVDDGSTDGTEATLTGLDPRLRYQWQPNRGPAAARNTGIELARGRLIAFLDSDDRWLPRHLEATTEVLRLLPAAIAVCTCPLKHVAGSHRPAEAKLVDYLPLALADESFGRLSCSVLRADELQAAGGFDEALSVGEDTDLFQRLAARGPFAVLQRRTIVRQHTRGSLLERGRARGAYVRSFEIVSKHVAEEAARSSRPDRAVLAAMGRGRLHYAATIRALAERDENGVARSLAEACRLLPELSRRPAAVARRIRLSASSADDHVSALAVAARLWPDRSSDTAVYLRLLGAAAALRRRRLRDAASLLGGLPFSRAVLFVVTNGPLWRRTVRIALERRLHRGAEPVALVQPGPHARVVQPVRKAEA